MHKKITFENKSRLILVPTQDTGAVTVLFLFGVGSRYEYKAINGASHFIEHLMFKGTKKRPTTLDISKALDGVGAEFNAMTSKDYTGYYVKINNQKADLAIDILSDMLLNSKFDAAEINRERGVIIEEINMYHENPMMYVESLMEEEMYKGSSLGWQISGPSSAIRNVTRKQLLDFKDAYYQPDNMVVVVAGKITGQVKALVEQKMIKKMKQTAEVKPYKPFVVKQKEPQIKLDYRNTRQVQLALGFTAMGYNDPRAYALHLMTIILGGNMSSRLFVSIRERRGLAYYVRCFPNFYQDIGNLYIQSGLDASRLDMALEVILKEMKRIKRTGVTAKELKDAKEFIRGKMVLSLEDSSNIAEFYAKQELLLGKTMSPKQKMNKYDAVTLTDIKKLASEILVKERFSMALIGPFKDKKRFFKKINL
jgi:predicted Zn-dependent peptidase